MNGSIACTQLNLRQHDVDPTNASRSPCQTKHQTGSLPNVKMHLAVNKTVPVPLRRRTNRPQLESAGPRASGRGIICDHPNAPNLENRTRRNVAVQPSLKLILVAQPPSFLSFENYTPSTHSFVPSTLLHQPPTTDYGLQLPTITHHPSSNYH